MKKLRDLNKAEKLAILTDIARGDIDAKQIDENTIFAVDVMDWYVHQRDKDPHVLLCGKALKADKTAMTINLEFVSKDWATGELICEPGPSLRVTDPGIRDD